MHIIHIVSLCDLDSKGSKDDRPPDQIASKAVYFNLLQLYKELPLHYRSRSFVTLYTNIALLTTQ